MLDGLWNDIRHAVRALGRRPGFAAIAILSLAWGLGATTTMVSVVVALDLRSLPYENAERIVYVGFSAPPDDKQCPVCPRRTPSFVPELERATGAFQSVMPYGARRYSFDDGTEVVPLAVAEVMPQHFAALGARPLLGRVIAPSDTLPGAELAAVASEKFWRTYLGADPSAIGRRFTVLDERAKGAPRFVRVVGVMPRSFDLPPYDLWTPLMLRSGAISSVVATLAPGVSIDRARRAMEIVVTRAAEREPSLKGSIVEMTSLRELLVRGDSTGKRFVLLGVVLLVLLLACGNVATLFIARVSASEREWATRSALGAGALRLARPVMVETMLVAVVGSALGLVLSHWGIEVTTKYLGVEDGALRPSLDWRVLALTLGMTILSSLVISTLPARRAARTDVAQRLRSSQARGATTARRGGLFGVLIGGQVAGAVMLAAGGCLLTKEFWRLQHIPLGFETDGLVVVLLAQPSAMNGARPQPTAALVTVAHAELTRLGATPGVASVAAEGRGVPSGRSFRTTRALTPEELAGEVAVTPGYFATLRVSLIAGRDFNDHDVPGSEPAGIVNETAARRLWPGESPLGRRIVIDIEDTKNGGSETITIVGVAPDVRTSGGRSRPVRPTLYRPYDQLPTPMRVYWVRPTATQASMLGGLRPILRELTPGHRLIKGVSITPIQEINRELAAPRFNAIALGAFASFAILLAAMGIFGLVSYAVSRQTREIGIRVALGGSLMHVLRVVAGPAVLFGSAGLLIGIGGTIAFSRILRSMLAGTSPLDPVALIAPTAMVGLALVAASLTPARRAARIDPASALRSD